MKANQSQADGKNSRAAKSKQSRKNTGATSATSTATVAHEFKVVSLRECPLPEHQPWGLDADDIAKYWRAHVPTHPHFNRDVECLVAVMINSRRRIMGHCLITVGTLDTLIVHPREVFRAAIGLAAAAVVLVHNHPSGDPSPSEADIKVTRDLIRAGQFLRIDLLDHLVMGAGESFKSLLQLGYFFETPEQSNSAPKRKARRARREKKVTHDPKMKLVSRHEGAVCTREVYQVLRERVCRAKGGAL